MYYVLVNTLIEKFSIFEWGVAGMYLKGQCRLTCVNVLLKIECIYVNIHWQCTLCIFAMSVPELEWV